MRLSLLALLALSAVALAATAFLPPSALAQEPQRPPSNPRPALEVDFGGGNGSEYVAAIRKASADANIVVLGELERITMPAARLRNVDVWSALVVLDSLPPQQGDQGIDVKIEEIIRDGERAPVYTVTARVVSLDKPRASSQQTTVVSMADLLGDDLTPADALKAIETALELVKGEYPPAQIKFHEQTGLLIARGSSEQVESIHQVIKQLRERASTIRGQREQAEIAKQSQANAERDSQALQQVRADSEALRQELTATGMRAELMQQEVGKLQRVVAEMEGQVRSLNAERDALARQLFEALSKAGGPQPQQ